MESVEEWFDWRADVGKKKSKTVEEKHRPLTKQLNWNYVDVLYSFLGIYTIGLMVFYPKEFIRCGSEIRPKGQGRQKAYSLKFLEKNFRKYVDLNELPALKDFLGMCESIGNVFPIWPGGNEHKGKSCCYDLPHIYLRRHETWFHHLSNIHQATYLEDVMALDGSDIESFLKDLENEKADQKKKYTDFLLAIGKIIKDRKGKILHYAKEQGINTDEYDKGDLT